MKCHEGCRHRTTRTFSYIYINLFVLRYKTNRTYVSGDCKRLKKQIEFDWIRCTRLYRGSDRRHDFSRDHPFFPFFSSLRNIFLSSFFIFLEIISPKGPCLSRYRFLQLFVFSKVCCARRDKGLTRCRSSPPVNFFSLFSVFFFSWTSFFCFL